jgi:hypothetical protein
VKVDLEGQLAKIEEAFKSVAMEAKGYFSRANEYQFFPLEDRASDWAKLDLTDPTNWMYVNFDMHVFAYSNVGTGQRFTADFGRGTFLPREPPEDDEFPPEDDECPPEEDECAGHSSSDDEDESSVTRDIMSNELTAVAEERQMEEFYYLDSSDDSDFDEDSESSDDDSELEELFAEEDGGDSSLMNDIAYEEEEQALSKVYGEPKHSSYNGTFTNVKVLRRQTFGSILSRKESAKKTLNDASVETGGAANDERTVLARSLVLLSQCISHGQLQIYDCKDSNIPDYLEVLRDFQISNDDWRRGPGWARRPESNMYGIRYTAEFRPVVVEIFNAGARNSSSKQGPAQILEVIEEKFPGKYRYPGEHDISSLISSLFQKEKDTGELEDDAVTTGEAMASAKIPVVIDKEIRRLIEGFPNETGKPIRERLERYYESSDEGFPACFPFTEQARKDVMNRVNYLRRYTKQKKAATAKRRLIG